MKRFLIYALLGPPIGLAVLFAMTALLDPHKRDPLDTKAGVVVLIPFSYLGGLPQAIIVAAVDMLLSKRLALGRRICACTGAGYAVTMLGMYGFHWPPVGRYFLFGLVGAIPAAVCAWLSGRATLTAASERRSAP
jgi:hypothetical protein